MTSYRVSETLTLTELEKPWIIEVHDFETETIDRHNLLDCFIDNAVEHIDNYEEQIGAIQSFLRKEGYQDTMEWSYDLDLWDPDSILDFNVRINPVALIDTLFDDDSDFTIARHTGNPFNIQQIEEGGEASIFLHVAYKSAREEVRALLNEIAMVDYIKTPDGHYKFYLTEMWKEACLRKHRRDVECPILNAVERLLYALQLLFDDEPITRFGWEVHLKAA